VTAGAPPARALPARPPAPGRRRHPVLPGPDPLPRSLSYQTHPTGHAPRVYPMQVAGRRSRGGREQRRRRNSRRCHEPTAVPPVSGHGLTAGGSC